MCPCGFPWLFFFCCVNCFLSCALDPPRLEPKQPLPYPCCAFFHSSLITPCFLLKSSQLTQSRQRFQFTFLRVLNQGKGLLSPCQFCISCHFLLQCMKVKSESEGAQSCPTLSDPMDCSPPGSSVHGIFQARVLEWGAIANKTLYFTCIHVCSYWGYIFVLFTLFHIFIISKEASLSSSFIISDNFIIGTGEF